MNRSEWLDVAIQNNMDWYQVEANSWQLPYARTTSSWWSLHTVPPFHSNLVACGQEPLALIDAIDSKLQRQWTIKDAHQQYNLEPHGFSVLFDALWFARKPGSWRTNTKKVQCASTAEEFSRWVNAWDETPENSFVFVPGLVNEPTVRFVYQLQDDKISAGLTANLSTRAIGITNTFGTTEGIDQCMAFVANTYPTLGLVGYDIEDEVIRLASHGVDALADLRIWQKTINP